MLIVRPRGTSRTMTSQPEEGHMEDELDGLRAERRAIVCKLDRMVQEGFFLEPATWAGYESLSANDKAAHARLERKLIGLDLKIRARDSGDRGMAGLPAQERVWACTREERAIEDGATERRVGATVELRSAGDI
jgi:hypothetical protein